MNLIVMINRIGGLVDDNSKRIDLINIYVIIRYDIDLGDYCFSTKKQLSAVKFPQVLLVS